MTSHIHSSKKHKGIFFVNGKIISLRDYRLCRYNDLTPVEIEHFEHYLRANKL